MHISSGLPMRIPFLSWVFLIPTCSLFLSSSLFVVSGQCLHSEESLLLQLKNDLIFDHDMSTKLARWNESIDCCMWEGITCQEGCVIGLDLTKEYISGGLNSSSLFALQYLQNLSLAYNKFNNSQIPSDFEKLTNLVYLNLSNAGFVGQIPIAISSLTRLVVLDFSVIYFTKYTLKLENPNLGLLIQNLSKLIELHLDGVNITAKGDEWCNVLSSQLPKLQVLSLSNCYLSGPIDASILMLKSLSTIRLDYNNLSILVPEFFTNFTNLKSLSLSSSGLYGTFPGKIIQVPTLEILNLSNNELLQGPLPNFPQNGSLRALMLAGTSFSGVLPSSLGNLKMLSIIDISACNFRGPIPSFTMAKNLIEIYFSSNDLSGSITSTNWQELSHLVTIHLSDNSLNGNIPLDLFSHPSLQNLCLSNNQFSGQLKEIPKVSSFLLNSLDLSKNKFKGPIPMFIFKLRGLTRLDLSSNNFNGSLQLELIQNLRNLANLDLSYNSLWIGYNGTTLFSSFFPPLTMLKLASCGMRKFPDFLSNQSKLLYLDLSCNQIGGSIPNWISKLDNLIQLNLSFNHLTTLEAPLSNLSSLIVLDLSFNQLQGQLPVLPPLPMILDFSINNFNSTIPPTIGNSLSSTFFFSLLGNNFYGHIPKSMCNASNLSVLDLSNNSFSGSIPKCLIEMSRTLGVLNLRRNNLNGLISDSFPDNCGLQTLDFNGNQIRGLLPRSLVNCTYLEVLNIGNNHIEDIFPCYLKKASMLRVLVLRFNKFYGDIGCLKPNVTWPMLQIIDGASNNFIGELPKNLSWKAMMGYEKATQLKPSHLQFHFLLSDDAYYQDSIIITMKGLDIELVKILNIFTLFDFSCNRLNGLIPQEIGELKFLHVLNLSHNGFTSQIPSSLGKLSNLESLDLSCNSLTGVIPQQLADGLIFLSVLNLSFNQLVGQIPSGKQFATFSKSSFEGNKGLCGFPLEAKCKDHVSPPTATPKSQDTASTMLFGSDGMFISIGLGFLVGVAWNVGLLMFWETGRRWCDETIYKILPQVLSLWDCLRQVVTM